MYVYFKLNDISKTFDSVFHSMLGFFLHQHYVNCQQECVHDKHIVFECYMYTRCQGVDLSPFIFQILINSQNKLSPHVSALNPNCTSTCIQC